MKIMIIQKKENGWILILTLLFLNLLVSLGFLGFELERTKLKLIHRAFLFDQLRSNGEQLLKKLENPFNIQNRRCMIPKMGADEWSQKNRVWWKANTCAGIFENLQYYYAIEFLTQDDCAYANLFDAIQYYRVNLFAASTQDEWFKIRLQSTFAVGVKQKSTVCHHPKREVQIGQQTLREIL